MTAAKSCWSILILEDNANLREVLQGNFSALLGNAVRVDFAASICQAIDKIKRQMQQGAPYDIFWVDLYLDYFSYDNEHGEIVSAQSFSQIVDTEAFLQQHRVTALRWPVLISLLQAHITPPHSEHYSDFEKLAVLKKFSPYCLPAARSSFATLLELLEFYLTAAQREHSEGGEENIYVHNALNFVFRKLRQWVSSSAQHEFEINNADREDRPESVAPDLVPSRNIKSDQSWTLFHSWVEQFYSHIALGARGYETYRQANPLLVELKRLSPEGYPLFLVNTAYPSRRADLLKTAAIWPAENVIIGRHDFKGGNRDRLLADYLCSLLRQCRRPYFFVRSHRRGSNAFLINDNVVTIAEKLPYAPAGTAPLSEEHEIGFAFSPQAFFPEFTHTFEKASNAGAEFLAERRSQALRAMQDCLLERQPRMMQHLRLTVPSDFFRSTTPHQPFLLELQTAEGTSQRVILTFDEGRWILFELVCRCWFPKCFYLHSSWTVLHKNDGQQVYFHSMPELLAAALVRARYNHPDLFPPGQDVERLARALRPTSSFYQAHTPYAEAFDWQAFWQESFGHLDTQHQRPGDKMIVLQARCLLIITMNVLADLHIRRLANRIFKSSMLTAQDWPTIMAATEFLPAERTLREHLHRLEKGEAASLQARDLLPKLTNLLSVLFCFYSFPTDELMQFYRYWEDKQIPMSGTRPTEKFSNITRKLENLRFTHSVSLPAQAEGKNRFLFVPASFGSTQSQILVAPKITANLSQQSYDDLTAKTFLEFLALFSTSGL